MDEYQLHTLPNGIRVAHKSVTTSQIAHLGIMLDIGSRDERPEQQGLAHFWEHMAFKGTERRNSFHILNRLETVGGELNAYTTKEKVCFHASLLKEHYEKALDLLADITFHSTFPEKGLEKERSVIMEEIAMYYDSPEDALADDFDDLLFAGHPLGTNILGTPETLRSFTRADLQHFIAENLDTERIVFSSVGNLPFKKVVQLAEKYLGDVPARRSTRVRISPNGYYPKQEQIARPIVQAHAALGRRAYALTDKRRLPFYMLVNLLGGPGMNSRLNLSVREKHGLVYSIDASYTPYLDTGFVGIYFGTERRQVNRALSLILKELKTLREKPLTSTQLHATKQQLMGQLAMAEEGNQSFMLMMGKSLLDLGRVEPLDELFAQIRAVSATQLQDMANEIFVEDQFCQLTFLPEN
jgi:predicted Zn-dependent peptidase